MMKTPVACSLAIFAVLAQTPGLLLADQATVLRPNEVTADTFTRAMMSGPAGPETELGPGVRARTLGARPVARATGVSVLITFETNSATLTPSAKAALDEIAKALSKEQLANLSFVLEGHADPRGTSEHNLHLSQARAESVMDYLVAHHGVSADRLKAVGKGEDFPLKPDQPTAPENRRVTFVPSSR